MLEDDPAVHPYRTEMTSPTDIRTSRRRDRDARATGSTRAQEEKKSRGRLPSAPRERRPLLAALAVILIVGGALLAGLLAARIEDPGAPVRTLVEDVALLPRDSTIGGDAPWRPR